MFLLWFSVPITVPVRVFNSFLFLIVLMII